MYLKNIKLANFKNYEDASFDFHPNVNGIVGANGSGKTNLLDAVHYLSFTKSFFVSQDKYAVRFGTDFFAVHGEFFTFDDAKNNKIGCTYKVGGRKIVKADGKEYDRFSDHIGRFPLVMVSPYDQDVINGGSELRRKFFDVLISQFDPEYLQQLISYQKVLVQRNTLLKQFIENHVYNDSLIQIFNEQLVAAGNYIFEKRKSFVAELQLVMAHYYQDLSDGRELADIEYDSGLNTMTFEEGLAFNEVADRKSGYTTFGIHKDDFNFLLDGNPVKRFGSQGQQKSFVLALRLAQFDYIAQKKEAKPILLLDDIFDKLDRQRTAHLLDLVGKDHFGQVFISDTDENRIRQILDSYHIDHAIFKTASEK